MLKSIRFVPHINYNNNMQNEVKRELASIQQISAIEPIEGADNILKATIKGWEVVISKKDNFQIGDKVVYIEVDSVMPQKPEYEFLRSRNFRVRTIKLKGQVSQGLILPLSILAGNFELRKFEVGQDVTEKLGVTKYLSPSERDEIFNQQRLDKIETNRLKIYMKRYSWYRRLFLSTNQKQSFPYWVSKTDEERIQNIPKVLEQFKEAYVYVTEKVDYQSVTFTSKKLPRYFGLLGKIIPLKKTVFIVCSRNLTTNDKNSLYWKIAEKYQLKTILKYNPDLTIQGEQGHFNVQGNKYGIKEPTLWVFNIINHKLGKHFSHNQIEHFCIKWGLQTVPTIGYYQLEELGTTVSELVEFAKGKSEINPSIHREGVVIRSVVNGQKVLSFKVINPDFLLKYDE